MFITGLFFSTSTNFTLRPNKFAALYAEIHPLFCIITSSFFFKLIAKNEINKLAVPLGTATAYLIFKNFEIFVSNFFVNLPSLKLFSLIANLMLLIIFFSSKFFFPLWYSHK